MGNHFLITSVSKENLRFSLKDGSKGVSLFAETPIFISCFLFYYVFPSYILQIGQRDIYHNKLLKSGQMFIW